MKKAGSSSSRSKTRQTSKSTRPKATKKKRTERPRKAASAEDARAPSPSPETAEPSSFDLDAFAAVGHQPGRQLSPQDEALFRAFQSNLLSLISHELRTPLMGIMNALSILDEDELENSGVTPSGLPRIDLIRMARQNAQRLHRTLIMLLDMASVEAGTFHVRLRELEISRLLKSRVQVLKSVLSDRSLSLQEVATEDCPVLGDSQKLARAIDLCIETAVFRAEPGSSLILRISSAPTPCLSLQFTLENQGERPWERAWLHGLAAYESGVGSPASAFAGVLQSEEAFLTRTEEGLGTEFLLVHEILRLHRGRFEQRRAGRVVTLSLNFPDFSSDDSIREVLSSRAFAVTTEQTSVALILVDVPSGRDLREFCATIKSHLHRTSDAAYSLPSKNRVALVLDDLARKDIAGILGRLEARLGMRLRASTSHCPDDVADPTQLLESAEKGFG